MGAYLKLDVKTLDGGGCYFESKFKISLVREQEQYMNLAALKDILNVVNKLPIIDIIILCTIIIAWIVGWIYTIVDTVISLIECKKCVWRKSCEFLIFSEHCQKRYCMSEEERKLFREKIKELD